jgi:hypothetical protein
MKQKENIINLINELWMKSPNDSFFGMLYKYEILIDMNQRYITDDDLEKYLERVIDILKRSDKDD